MNRILTYLNLAGVLALAMLCIGQWQGNSLLSSQNDRVTKAGIDQETKIQEQQKTISDNTGQMDDLRGRLVAARAASKDAEEKSRAATQQLQQAIEQRDQLKANLTQWMNAVAARDAEIKKAGDEIQKISAQRSDAQQRLNDLTTKYNAIARQ